MAVSDDIARVKKNVSAAYDRKRKAALAICLQYAAIAVQYIRQAQASNAFWQNQTGAAKDTLFGGSTKTKEYIGWFIAHGVQYGIYLERANNRQNAVLVPTIARFYNRFQTDIKKIYGASA